MSGIHKLKIWPDFLRMIKEGKAKAEFRKNDRNYQAGDILILSEWNPDTEKYTGNEITVSVSHVKDLAPFVPGYVLLSIEPKTDIFNDVFKGVFGAHGKLCKAELLFNQEKAAENKRGREVMEFEQNIYRNNFRAAHELSWLSVSIREVILKDGGGIGLNWQQWLVDVANSIEKTRENLMKTGGE